MAQESVTRVLRQYF